MTWTREEREQNRILHPELVFCAWVMLRSMRLARDKLYFDGIYNPKTGEEPTVSALHTALLKSRFYKIYDAKRNPDLGGVFEPDAPPTANEYEFASKYYLENVGNEAKRIYKLSKEILERA
jgi:hypothetical protein